MLFIIIIIIIIVIYFISIIFLSQPTLPYSDSPLYPAEKGGTVSKEVWGILLPSEIKTTTEVKY